MNLTGTDHRARGALGQHALHCLASHLTSGLDFLRNKKGNKTKLLSPETVMKAGI